jgi:hypothetical protein
MKKMKKILTTSLLVMLNTISLSIKANEQFIAKITNEDNPYTYNLVIDSNEDNRVINFFYKDVYQEGKRVRREALDFKVINKKELVLEQRDKYLIMGLKSNNFDSELGGVITIDTLYSGVNNSRKEYDLDLTKDRAGWILVKTGKVIKHIHIQSNKMTILGTVGIKNLIMN